MHKDVRDLVKWAEGIGWTRVKRPGDAAHVTLRHTNGTQFTIPATPSDARSMRNARADLRRKAGVSNESGPAAKYRHRPHREGFNMQAALYERDQRIEDAVKDAAERLELRMRLFELLEQARGIDPKIDRVQAVRLASDITRTRKRLRQLGVKEA